jgi:hypothetical protein
LYPEIDVESALATTAIPFTRVGNVITLRRVTDILELAYIIWYKTVLANPIPPPPEGAGGYPIGVGTYLTDQGKELFLKLESGETVVHYRLFKAVSPQTDPPVSNPAIYTPNGTIGYTMIFVSGPAQEFDPVRYVRTG